MAFLTSLQLLTILLTLTSHIHAQAPAKVPSTTDHGPVFAQTQGRSLDGSVAYNISADDSTSRNNNKYNLVWLGNSTAPWSVELWETPEYQSAYTGTSSSNVGSSNDTRPTPPGAESPDDRFLQYLQAHTWNNTYNWVPDPPTNISSNSSLYYYIRITDTNGYYNNTPTFSLYDSGSDSTTTYSYSDGLSKGAIAGIAIGSAIGAALLGLAIFFFLRRRKRRRDAAGANAKNSSSYSDASQGYEKPELPSEEPGFWKKMMFWHGDGNGKKGAVEMEAVQEEKVRGELMGDVPEVVELPAENVVVRER